MRGIHEKPTQLFSYVDLERRIPLDHSRRAIRALVDKVLAGQSRTFTKLYARDGRPKRLLRALLLQAFYSVRSATPWRRWCNARGRRHHHGAHALVFA
jgi:transposase